MTPCHPLLRTYFMEREMSRSCVRLSFQCIFLPLLRLMLTTASQMKAEKTSYLVPAKTTDSVRVPVHRTQLKFKSFCPRESLFAHVVFRAFIFPSVYRIPDLKPLRLGFAVRAETHYSHWFKPRSAGVYVFCKYEILGLN